MCWCPTGLLFVKLVVTKNALLSLSVILLGTLPLFIMTLFSDFVKGLKSNSVPWRSIAMVSTSLSSTCLFVPCPVDPSFQPFLQTAFSLWPQAHNVPSGLVAVLITPLSMHLLSAASSPLKSTCIMRSYGFPPASCSLNFSFRCFCIG